MDTTPTDLRLLPSGYTLHEYRIVRALGTGGFGITYLVRDTHLGTEYALKEYLPRDLALRGAEATVQPLSGAEREDFDWGKARFLSEARTLAQFHHPHLVGVVRYFEANGTAYMVMEYVAGEEFLGYVTRVGPLPEGVLRGLLTPLLDGLSAVHEAGYLHRDIKPDNIVLRGGDVGSPVLLDFGAARLAMGAHSRHLTVVLTPGYAPIEQYSEASEQGPYTDVYALGAVLYYGLTGEAPQEATDRMLDDRLPSRLAQLAGSGGLSRDFLSGLEAALQVDPRNRPASLEAWRRQLDSEGTLPESALRANSRPEVAESKAGASDGEKTFAAGELRPDFHRLEVDRYWEWFEKALEKGDFDKAAAYLKNLEKLHPTNSPSLAEGKRLLEEKSGGWARLAEWTKTRSAEKKSDGCVMQGCLWIVATLFLLTLIGMCSS